ncbi:nuclear transport factor 2 family protein [Rhodococcoides yunnanense]|uniref:nuclear transport factor 2 family protein n=1 Tax=Rhodococcoides yunnanense TaxID=278209 RepID=UPI00093517E9|nr:nuclear transport factor 2 family protein [Rhodococcus yunnanensis]
MTNRIDETTVTEWVEAYVHAWTTNDSGDIEALFAETAEYHEKPYTTAWIGRDAVVAGWQGRWEWQSGGWMFEWQIESIVGNVAVITGIGRYDELGDFANHWTVAFDDAGLCTRFEMVNEEL